MRCCRRSLARLEHGRRLLGGRSGGAGLVVESGIVDILRTAYRAGAGGIATAALTVVGADVVLDRAGYSSAGIVQGLLRSSRCRTGRLLSAGSSALVVGTGKNKSGYESQNNRGCEFHVRIYFEN